MTYASLITHVGVDERSRERLACAADLAAQLKARLIGVAAEAYPVPVTAPEAAFIDAGVTTALMERVHADFRTAQSIFEDLVPTAEPGDWRAGIGRPVAIVAREARAADLVVASASHVIDADVETQAAPGDLIMMTGRPVLIAPSDHRAFEGRSAVVAWKDTREARGAVADALPLLMRADHVAVVEAFAGEEREAAAARVQDVCRALRRHGVEAHAHARPRRHGGAAETLFEIADEHGADLIVAGAYGHSRLQEWIFGGVTQRLLADGRRFVLMSH
jgi:nucleotide-binding universal stress UspA family protein